jgi:gamma-carbonic anhydrase
MILEFDGKSPVIHETAFVAPNATLIGDVQLGEQSSIWFGCVVRGDEHPVKIGARTNIQDLTMCHETSWIGPLIIGDDVTVGHRAIIHGCTIGDRCLIGMGAIIMDSAVIGEESIVAAGSVVLEGQVVPPRSLVAGVPAKVRREINEQDLVVIRTGAEHYVEHAKKYLAAERR